MSRNGQEHTHQDVQLSLEYLQQLGRVTLFQKQPRYDGARNATHVA